MDLRVSAPTHRDLQATSGRAVPARSLFGSAGSRSPAAAARSQERDRALAEHFARSAAAAAPHGPALSPEACEALLAYRWPGKCASSRMRSSARRGCARRDHARGLPDRLRDSGTAVRTDSVSDIHASSRSRARRDRGGARGARRQPDARGALARPLAPRADLQDGEVRPQAAARRRAGQRRSPGSGFSARPRAGRGAARSIPCVAERHRLVPGARHGQPIDGRDPIDAPSEGRRARPPRR